MAKSIPDGLVDKKGLVLPYFETGLNLYNIYLGDFVWARLTHTTVCSVFGMSADSGNRARFGSYQGTGPVFEDGV